MPVEIGNGQVPTEQEDVVFLPSGKIRVMVAEGDVRTLRRPKFGEFRDFREILYEEQDRAHEALIEKANQLIEEATTDEQPGGKTAEQRRAELLEIVEAGRKIRSDTEQQEAHYIKWCRDVVSTLSGKPVEIEDRELPMMFSSGDFVTAVQRHWRSVPLPSGVR